MEFIFVSYPYIDRCTSRVDWISAWVLYRRWRSLSRVLGTARWWSSVYCRVPGGRGRVVRGARGFCFLSSPEPMHSLRRDLAVLLEEGARGKEPLGQQNAWKPPSSSALLPLCGRPALMPFCRFDCSINGLTTLPSGLSRLVNLQW
jgi:hypothetical protein